MGVVRGDNSLFFATVLDNNGLRKGSSEAVGIIQGLATKVSKVNPLAGVAATALATFSAIAVGSFKMMRNFEQAMKEVETISAATQKDFKGLSQAVFDLSKISPDNPEKLAKAYYQIVSAGYDGAKGLKLLKTATKAALGGVTDTITAADGLTTVLNAWGIKAEQVTQVSDTLFNTVKLGKTTFSELAAHISVVAPIAAASGISFKQVAAAVATLTKQGVPTAVAMTQLRSAIIGANKVLGDGWSKTMTLQQAFQLLYDKANGSQIALQGMIGRVEAVSGVLAIAGKHAKGAKEDLASMNHVMGATKKASDEMLSSNINQWAILSNEIKAAIKGIGEEMLEVSSWLAKFFNRFFHHGDTLEDHYNSQREAVYKLKDALQSVNKDSKERIKIIKKIIATYPDYFKGIDAEKASNDELLSILDQINNAYELQYKLKQRRKPLKKALEAQGDLENKFAHSIDNFKTQLAKLQRVAKDKGIKLKIDFSQSEEEILSALNKQLKNVEGAFDISLNSGDKVKEKIKGFAQGHLDNMQQQIFLQKDLNKKIKEAKKTVADLTAEYERLRIIDFSRKENLQATLSLIKKAKTPKDLLQFKGVNLDEVKKAVAARLAVIQALNKIKKITKTGLDKGALSKYLNAKNEEIRKAAEKRKRLLTFKVNIDPDKEGKQDKYLAFLQQQKQGYELYEQQVTAIQKKAIQKRYNLQLGSFKSFNDLLASEIKKNENNAQKITDLYKVAGDKIYNYLSKATLNPDLLKVEQAPKLKAPGVKLPDIKLDFDKTFNKDYVKSIKELEKELGALQHQFRVTNSRKEQALLSEKIDNKKKEIEAAKNATQTEKDLYSDLTQSLSDLDNKALRNYIDNQREKLEAAKKGSEEAKKLKRDIVAAEVQMIANTINQITGIINQASSLFRKFGKEDLAKLLDQLEGVAQGAGEIAEGIFVTHNPFDIIEGGLKVINSALTVEVVSDTAKYEKRIEELKKDASQLDYLISKSTGKKKEKSINDEIKDQKALQEQYKKQIQAELNARKQVKFFGIRMGKKRRGSGTDPAKIKELNQKIETAKRKAQELKEQLDQFHTGTTKTTIVDSIISGLKQGKTSVKDFAGNFKDLMQNAMLTAFKTKYLTKEVEKFYDTFADAGSDDKYTAEEIANLRNLYNQMIQGAQGRLDSLNKVLEDSGVDPLGSKDNQQTGLAGGIEKITEDTANILAGTLNSIRIDIKEGLESAQQSLTYLSQIAQNTSYNHYMESMDIRLSNIETLLS